MTTDKTTWKTECPLCGNKEATGLKVLPDTASVVVPFMQRASETLRESQPERL